MQKGNLDGRIDPEESGRLSCIASYTKVKHKRILITKTFIYPSMDTHGDLDTLEDK